MVFAANAFWAIPYVYSGLNTGSYIQNSRINEFSSEEIFFRNKTFGDLTSVLSLKGFMIDTIELDSDSFENVYFMSIWRDLTNSVFYKITYLGFFAIIAYGIFTTIKKRRLDFLPFLLTGSLAFVFLANNTPVFSQTNDAIRSVFPLLGEAFRFPFTKFITLFAFSLSALFAIGLSFLIKNFKEYEKYLIICIGIGALVLSYPAFFGYFTSPFLRETLPKEYLSLFSDMQNKNHNQRVAIFPVQTFWNWQYRSWGHRGSGFSWYGIPQPVFERAFDPWSPYDEQFFNEISYAVNAQDQQLLNNVLSKYDISYILLDQNILNTLSRKEINYDSLKKFLTDNPLISVEKEYGKLILYKVKHDSSWVYSLNSSTTKSVFPNYAFEKEDSIYPLTDNYVSSTKDPSVINLFPSLYTEKLQENIEFNVKNDEEQFMLTPKKNLPYDLSKYILRIPSLFETEFLVPVKVALSGGRIILTPTYPTISINGETLLIEEEPIVLSPTRVFNPAEITFSDTKQVVSVGDNSAIAYILNPALNTIKLTNSSGAEELIYLDTQGLNRKAFYASLPPGVISDLSITFPKVPGSQSHSDIIEKRQYQIREIGSPFSRPYSEVETTQGLGYVELSAVDKVNELTFYLPDLYHQASYILFAKTKYQSGLPMNFYVDNDVEKRAEVEAVFSKTIEDTTIVIPKSTDFFKGYGFHFIVESVGKEKGQTLIRDIEIYPFPSRFLRALQIVDFNTYSNPENENKKIPRDFTKVSQVLYTTTGNPGTYLTLSQAYDKGWAAYKLVNSQWSMVNWFNRNFPFIFGEPLEHHVLVNNWANGWEIPRSSIVNSQSSIVIVYLPQYLAYFGFFVTTTSFLFLYIVYFKKRHQR